MTIRQADKKRKWLHCLRCGKKMWTDRCHRICRKCTIANRRSQYASSPSPVRVMINSSYEHADW